MMTWLDGVANVVICSVITLYFSPFLRLSLSLLNPFSFFYTSTTQPTCFFFDNLLRLTFLLRFSESRKKERHGRMDIQQIRHARSISTTTFTKTTLYTFLKPLSYIVGFCSPVQSTASAEKMIIIIIISSCLFRRSRAIIFSLLGPLALEFIHDDEN